MSLNLLAPKPDPAAWGGYSLWLINDGDGGSEMVRVPSERSAADAIAYAINLPNSKIKPRSGRISAELIA
ncbi:hypothetical protein FHW79_005347 [Azospirillum sp. OGB3]|uniref:hypothetical protein n=1 Tax=Azospirillum sp. OGB3 TaxID=2587012 RepID=UPI001605C330|nr:hypothetical protein [Azospirillum sp. OGB3]MBB3267682.1 hypothetical protein [Azospirillum sp. OGB3]